MTHYLNLLDVSRFQEILTAVNTRRSIHQEHYTDMARIKDFLNQRGAEGEEVFDYEERKVTLEQVMAPCVEVEKRAPLKANLGVPAPIVNAVNIQVCHYCGKPGHKYRMCRHKDSDQAKRNCASSYSKTSCISAAYTYSGSYSTVCP